MSNHEIHVGLLDELFEALAAHLNSAGARCEIVVIGGAGLMLGGHVERATADVDVVALVERGNLIEAEPLPPELMAAARRVAVDYGLGAGWLNAGPAGLLRLGLPSGLASRTTARRYGDSLTVHVADRYDLIHFKLYAMVDQGAGRHESDLRAMTPDSAELLAAARWATTHDPSPAFRGELIAVLDHLGVNDVDL